MFKKVLRDVYTSVSACNFSTWSPPFFVSLREKLTFIREKRRIIAQIYRRRLPVASSILKIVLKIRSIINRFPGASAPSATRSGGKRIYLARLDCYDEPAISTHLGWQKKTKRFERERERERRKIYCDSSDGRCELLLLFEFFPRLFDICRDLISGEKYLDYSWVDVTNETHVGRILWEHFYYHFDILLFYSISFIISLIWLEEFFSNPFKLYPVILFIFYVS